VGGRNLRIYALAMLPSGPTSKPFSGKIR
jgi:hypothetical protein